MSCDNSWQEQKDVALIYEGNTDLPVKIYGDKYRLRQILLNLIGNAIKFTEKGNVVLTVMRVPSSVTDNGQRTNTKIRFQVEDTGIGISGEKLKEIFLPFHQASGRLSKAEGTGLGLAISQRLVRMMGGELHVESTPGQGSKFWFTADMPEIEWETESADKIEALKDIIGFKGPARKILIADDSEKNRMILKDMLSPPGFEIFEAVDGSDALDKAIEFQPDVILMDLTMPGLDSYEVAKQIRQIPLLKHVIIIAVSANLFGHTQRKSLAAGCDDFLAKPVQLNDLMKLLQIYLKLEWTYEYQEEQNPKTAHGPVIPPPKKEIAELYQFVITGDIRGLRKQSTKIELLNPDFAPFAAKISQLTDMYKFDEIQELIEPYLKLET